LDKANYNEFRQRKFNLSKKRAAGPVMIDHQSPFQDMVLTSYYLDTIGKELIT
jgi:hypothetical protein